jgi:hypothetical protein
MSCGFIWMKGYSQRSIAPMTRSEAVTLALANAAGVAVPDWRLETIARKPVLLRRFDRSGANVRIRYMSGMTGLRTYVLRVRA